MAPYALPLCSLQSLPKNFSESTFLGRDLQSSAARSSFARTVKYTSIVPIPVVFANGAIHCICDADAHLSSRRGPSKKHILAFDMVEGGQLRKFPHPDDSFPGELTQFGGRLALIEDFSSRESSFSFGSEKGSDEVEYDKLRIWILEDYKNLKWVKETIHLPFGWMRYNHLLAFDYNTGEMLLKSQGVAGHFLHSLYFIYYNTKTGTFRREEVTGFPNWVKEDRIYSRVVEVNFDDEMDRQKSF